MTRYQEREFLVLVPSEGKESLLIRPASLRPHLRETLEAMLLGTGTASLSGNRDDGHGAPSSLSRREEEAQLVHELVDLATAASSSVRKMKQHVPFAVPIGTPVLTVPRRCCSILEDE